MTPHEIAMKALDKLQFNGANIDNIRAAIQAAIRAAEAEARERAIDEVAKLFPCTARGAESFHREPCAYHRIRALKSAPKEST